jgi:hypothetical protein
MFLLLHPFWLLPQIPPLPLQPKILSQLFLHQLPFLWEYIQTPLQVSQSLRH